MVNGVTNCSPAIPGPAEATAPAHATRARGRAHAEATCPDGRLRPVLSEEARTADPHRPDSAGRVCCGGRERLPAWESAFTD